MLSIIQDHNDEIDDTIAKKVVNIGLWTSDLHEKLKPVATAFDIDQRNASIMGAWHLSLELLHNPDLPHHE